MSRTRLDELKEHIEAQGWNWGPGKSIPHGEQILVSDAGVTALVNFWQKRGKMQVQGSDSPLKVALQTWVTGQPGHSPTGVPQLITGSHIGLDESGKGDWFGPLVIAAVYADDKTTQSLQQIGVRDSKMLAPSTLQILAGQIEQIIPAQYRHVTIIDPERYNELHTHHKNVELLLADAYAQTAQKVWQTVQTNTIVCDQFAQKKDRLEGAFATANLPRPIQQHKAESASIAVAAASILATAAFADALAQLGQEAAFDGPLPKGASDTATLEAAVHHIIQLQGQEALNKYAKLHFKPLKKFVLPTNIQINQESVHTIHHGPNVTIQHRAWIVQFHPSGFWRYTFHDGGYLDWYEDSTKGTIYVHGKASAESVHILKPKTVGKGWHGDLDKLTQAIAKYIPKTVDKAVPSVVGVGWHRKDTVLGFRFEFTDGAILQYYSSSDNLHIQGKPYGLTHDALSALPSPFWQGPEVLTDTLKLLFPDWQFGLPTAQEDETDASWKAVENAMNWNMYWPLNRRKRLAANKKSPCQLAMLEDWASVLSHHQDKKHLLAHAPTGLGKTLAALVPALAWVAQEPDQRRLYYLVNRVTQHENPLRELKTGLAELFEQQTGQPLHVIDIVGRAELCLHSEAHSLPNICKRSRDEASFAMLPDGVASWIEVKAHLGEQACPYHTLQGLMAQAHVVICDYWWLFSQQAQTGELTGRAGFSSHNTIIIVDEAHNLPLRVRSELNVEATVPQIQKELQVAPEAVQNVLRPILRYLYTAETGVGISPTLLVAQVGSVHELHQALDILVEAESVGVSPSLLERMLRVLLLEDETVIIYTEAHQNDKNFIFRMVDPTPVLRVGYNQVHASLSMSGTLASPADNDIELVYQVPLFGLPLAETVTRKYASPFPLSNQRWIYCTDTYGTYRERDNYLSDYARHIVVTGQATPGVTAVFFSSYAFLQKVQKAITDLNEQHLIVVETSQDRDLGEYERRLQELVEAYGRAYLFAAYSGKLAEGADFSDNLIKTVICISIPMEYPNLFHERLQAQYVQWFDPIAIKLGDEPSGKAREYALDRFSLSMVLQACGRGIRSETDRCAFVLLDRRYHDFGWRRFLSPRPYNVHQPVVNINSFHQRSQIQVNGQWDPTLLLFMIRE